MGARSDRRTDERRHAAHACERRVHRRPSALGLGARSGRPASERGGAAGAGAGETPASVGAFADPHRGGAPGSRPPEPHGQTVRRGAGGSDGRVGKGRKMRIKLENKTDYLDRDLLAFVHGALAAVGIKWRGIRVRGRNGKLCPLLVEVRYTLKYRGECHGRAAIGTNQRFHGLWMMLALPKPPDGLAPSEHEPRCVKIKTDFVGVLVHEAMHLAGVKHSAMTDEQRFCTLPLPEWAKEMPLRWAVEDAAGKLAAARAGRLEHARGMLRRAETRAKRAATIAKKWRRRLAALERVRP